MKNNWFSFVCFISLGAYAQEESVDCKVSDEHFNFKGKSITLNQDTKTLTLNEDANYKDGIIEIIGADQIIFDQANKEIIVTGNYDFIIDGAIQYSNEGTAPKVLRYRIGEDTAYID